MNKCITKIEKKQHNSNTRTSFDEFGRVEFQKCSDNAMKMMRKRKGRLYSLGATASDGPKREGRGRLDRLKTIGTFDLGTETIDRQKLIDEKTGRVNYLKHEHFAKSLQSREGTPRRIVNKNLVSVGIKYHRSAEDCIQKKQNPMKTEGKARSLSIGSNSSQAAKEFERTKPITTTTEFTVHAANIESPLCKTPCSENKNPRKTLTKTRNIVRTDSELFADHIMQESSNSNNGDSSQPTSETPSSNRDSINRLYDLDIETIDDMPLKTEPDPFDSDAVFSDGSDLERIEREYQEIVRSSLKREYKSDGDTLDEVGKKDKENKWHNQSIENEIEYYGTGPEKPTDVARQTSSSEVSTISLTRKSEELPPKKCDAVPKNSSSFFKLIPKDEHKSTTSETSNERSSKSNLAESIKTNLFEKRFSKFKKMNKLLKCKRFSTSALYEKRKSPGVTSPSGDTSSPSIKSRSSPNKTNNKDSIYSSKPSLFNKTLQSYKKSRMFSRSSRSNNELYSKTGSKTRLGEMSKSSTEISRCRPTHFKFSTKRLTKDLKNNSSACLHVPTVHSPLSEEFYNKTGSVRLSAVELYEKFCSEDFGGLYKDEARYMGNHGGEKVGYMRYKRRPLLRQKSEPKFSMSHYDANSGLMYLHEEEDESIYGIDNYMEKHDECYDEYEDDFDEQGDDYEDEEELDDEEYDEEEEDERDLEEIDEDDINHEPHRSYYSSRKRSSVKSHSLENIIQSEGEDIYEDKYENHASRLYYSEGEDDGTDLKIQKTDTEICGVDSEIDEIYLMPDDSKYAEYESYYLKRQDQIREDNSHDAGDGVSVTNSMYKIEENDNLSESNDDEVLTIYKINVREDATMSHDAAMAKDTPRNIYMYDTSSSDGQQPHEVQADESSIQSTAIDRSPSIKSRKSQETDVFELLSSASENDHSGSTLTEYEFDTVKNLYTDSCSTSKLSLSIKSEIFDNYTVTIDNPKEIQNFSFEDFTLTPDGSIGETADSLTAVSPNRESPAEGSKDNSVIKTIHDNNTVSMIDTESEKRNSIIETIDKFLCSERNSANLSFTHAEDIEKMDDQIEKFFNEQEKRQDLSNEPEIQLFDTDETPFENVVSSFTTELNKEFDLLFSKAHDNECLELKKSPNNSPSKNSFKTNLSNVPLRYSMEKLEPIMITNHETSTNKSNNRNANSNNHDSNTKTKSVKNTKFNKTRSKSLGNLNRKTRCFLL